MTFEYQEKNGYLYPVLQISNDKADDEQPLGKYAMMWLKFMHEFHQDRYTEFLMAGELLHMAHQINDETHEQVELIMKKSKDITQRLITEDQVIKEFVLIAR